MTKDIAPIITLDIDWAPDFVLENVLQRLLKHKVRATWFVTHATPFLDRLRQYPDLFELGIHPNFHPGSSHGSNSDEIFSYLFDLVPEAVSMRTHGLVQSSQMLDYVTGEGRLKYDLSLFIHRLSMNKPTPYICKSNTLTRYVYGWEDDIEVREKNPIWTLDGLKRQYGDHVIMDFHPIDIYLNSHTFEAYETVKKINKDFKALTEEQVAPHILKGAGPSALFDEVLAHMNKTGAGARIKDLATA